jgi:formylglycine-generating enzyme required for sulfatase activity
MRFVAAGGYQNNNFWTIGKAARRGFVTSDGRSPGPGNWPSTTRLPRGEEDHPVRSICYAEAVAFVAWCNAVTPPPEQLAWSLPPEDHWEFAARSEEGLIYPWGDAFDPSRCNSAESNFRTTTPVTRYAGGASRAGCYDMAGNVWEFVFADDTHETNCVLRGGSFSNDRFEVRSYLRLFAVPVSHRPPDFGFRLAQVDQATAKRQQLPLEL